MQESQATLSVGFLSQVTQEFVKIDPSLVRIEASVVDINLQPQFQVELEPLSRDSHPEWVDAGAENYYNAMGNFMLVKQR